MFNYETSRKDYLLRHIRIHTSVQKIEKNQYENKCNRRQYECHLCKYFTQCMSNLKQHTRSRHTAEKLYKCRFCAKAFLIKYNLIRHLRTHIKQLPFDCSICGQRFENENGKQLHEARCYGRRYECYLCRYQSHTKCLLTYHIRSKHTGEAPFQYAIRDKKSVRKSSLKRHLTMHAKKRSIDLFRCTKYLRNFTQESEKDAHERLCTHRHYQCYRCKIETRSLSNLNQHVRALHMGEKPFQCKLCDARFAQRGCCNVHMKRKHFGMK